MRHTPARRRGVRVGRLDGCRELSRHRESPGRCDSCQAPTQCIPDMAFSPRTLPSQERSSIAGSPGSARPQRPSMRSVTRFVRASSRRASVRRSCPARPARSPTSVRSSNSRSATGFRSRSRRLSVAVAEACASPARSTRYPRFSSQRCAKQSRRSAAANASSSATSIGRDTSRPSALPTHMVTSSLCRHATAHCSGDIRSSSKKRRPRFWPTPRSRRCTRPRRTSCAQRVTSALARSSFSSATTRPSRSSR